MGKAFLYTLFVYNTQFTMKTERDDHLTFLDIDICGRQDGSTWWNTESIWATGSHSTTTASWISNRKQ
jgi:hypothetical protein